jgi:hypothetical protein
MCNQGVVIDDTGEILAKPGMVVPELLATRAGREGQVLSNDDRRFSSWMKPIVIEGYQCGAIAIFTDGKLKLFYFGPIEEDDRVLKSEQERNNPLMFYQRWVDRRTGSEGGLFESSWGSVYAATDPHLNEASIYFDYEEKARAAADFFRRLFTGSSKRSP